MAIHSPARKLDLEDFFRLPEDGSRHEILDGVHVVTPPPDFQHQAVLGNLYFELRLYLREHPLGMAYFSPLGVRLADHDVVEPDLVYVSNERAASITSRYIAGAPDLVVEALSPSTWRRDLGSKRARYELLGVPEYWVLDPERSTATVYRREGSAFLPPVLLAAEAGDRLTTPLLPGLSLPLVQVFPAFRPTAS